MSSMRQCKPAQPCTATNISICCTPACHITPINATMTSQAQLQHKSALYTGLAKAEMAAAVEEGQGD